MKNMTRESKREGRIINVSSDAHHYTYKEGIHFDKINDESEYNSFAAYCQSKLANLLRANELARQLKEDGVEITANSLHPGVISTNLFRNMDIFKGFVNIFGRVAFKNVQQLSGQRADLSLKGSPYWMAPELMQDNRCELALVVDIWSLGCTIIEMYTGKAPWSEYEGAAAMFKVMRDTPPTPETLSPDGKDFLRRCFQRNPAENVSSGYK